MDYVRIGCVVKISFDWKEGPIIVSYDRCLSGLARKLVCGIAGFVLFGILPCAAGSIVVWGSQEWYHWSYADFNYDFVVDVDDLAEMAIDWLTGGYVSDSYGPGTDINKDGVVNFFDFALYADEFGRDAEDEFGPGHGKIRVSVRKGYDLAAAAPEIGSMIKVENISTGTPDDYEINRIITNVGKNQGVDTLAQTYTNWLYDLLTDRDKVVQWTEGLYFDRLKVGGDMVFVLYSTGGVGEDPSNLFFESELIEAETSEGYYCNTVNAPMPHKE